MTPNLVASIGVEPNINPMILGRSLFRNV